MRKPKAETYDAIYERLLKINQSQEGLHRAKASRREQKTYHTFASREDRLANWQFAREDYTIWRQTEEAQKWIAKRRKKQCNLCFICLSELGRYVHIDHIFPLYLGGTNASTNLCLTHPACNMAKGIETYENVQWVHRRRQLFNQLRKGVLMAK